jgi:fumarate reductase flavoprotein subunit
MSGLPESSILPPDQADFIGTIPIVVIGAGACGLTAALAADDAGAQVLVLERDASAMGTTAMSTGLIPGAGSRFQHALGIEDTPALFAQDVVAKTEGAVDRPLVEYLAEVSAATVEWLADHCKVPLSLVDTFLYPGHSRMRMHGTPNRTGAELMGALQAEVERRGLDILLEAQATHLFADAHGRVHGVRIRRPDGAHEDIGCGALVLACCGFGGNAEMVQRYIPEIASGTFFGHPGNKGDAVRWGEALGAKLADMHAYQGHGGLAAGQGVPILWAHIVHGGFQVNLQGRRFANEARGYSEQAVDILAQTGHVAWSIFDERIHMAMGEFDDYRDALEARCVLRAENLEDLATMTGLPRAALADTLAEVAAMARGERSDALGRDFTRGEVLAPPYRAVKVTGALFHTQGGLEVDGQARVLRADGTPLPNLFAGGGAARGISGPGASGYLAGNGLLTATALGRAAGRAAAGTVR